MFALSLGGPQNGLQICSFGTKFLLSWLLIKYFVLALFSNGLIDRLTLMVEWAALRQNVSPNVNRDCVSLEIFSLEFDRLNIV